MPHQAPGHANSPQPILDEVNRRTVNFDPSGVEQKRTVMLQGVALLGRAGGKVESPTAGGAQLLDQSEQHPLVLSAYAL
jgi:hypothetical protein